MSVYRQRDMGIPRSGLWALMIRPRSFGFPMDPVVFHQDQSVCVKTRPARGVGPYGSRLW